MKMNYSSHLPNALITLLTLMIALGSVGTAQQASSRSGMIIQGTVHVPDGKVVEDAIVWLENKDGSSVFETKSNSSGAFAVSVLQSGSYLLIAKKADLRSRASVIIVPLRNGQRKFDLTLEDPRSIPLTSSSSLSASTQAMKFADKPNFSVAGVTDWTAIGGHGSDSSLRTSEALASETLMLKPEGQKRGSALDSIQRNESERDLRAALVSAPGSFKANHQLGEFYLRVGRYREAIPALQSAYRIDPTDQDNVYDLALAYDEADDFSQARIYVEKLMVYRKDANWYRLAGELDEKLGNPLVAVGEFEQAVRLLPSEQNYFEWGSELLLHRAVLQAQEVFRKGADAYPKSARMLTGLGTALFAGALYNEAALRLCNASDLNPADQEPYIFMGKIQIAAPNPLACVEQKLERFAQEQPKNSVANYLYAMAILKRQEQLPDEKDLQEAKSLLTKAVTINTHYGDAYLQLGIIAASEGNYEKAIALYEKAVEADPQLSDAHYRLGVAYDRIGKPTKAKQEFQIHDELKKQQAEATDRQRREVKQFMVVMQGRPTFPPAQ